MKPAHGTAVDGSDACGNFKNAFYIMNIKEKKRLFRQKVVPLQVEKTVTIFLRLLYNFFTIYGRNKEIVRPIRACHSRGVACKGRG
jgi:hypothetical protein